jgi:hypothetical protein
MTRRLGRMLVVLAVVTLPGCTTSSAEPNPASAIQKVLAVSGFADSTQTFPDHPGEIACTIHGGGPYPGIHVPGRCQTSALWNGSVFFVTLTEYWDASAFYGGDTDPHQGQLSHSWRYAVDGAGKVTLLADWGNFPPQEVM